MDNKLWLTEEQIEVSVSILKKQCERIEERNQKLSDDFPDLFDELYYTGRGHGDTGAVYAGFTEATEIPDMKVYRVKYGRGYWQPELHSDTAVIQLYNMLAHRRNMGLSNFGQAKKDTLHGLNLLSSMKRVVK